MRGYSLAAALLWFIAIATPILAQAQARLPSFNEVNLLAPDQGGQALVVPNDEWFKPINGDEKVFAHVTEGQEAVYGFKDEKPAIFSRFSVLITEQSLNNPKQIELLVGDDSITGTFRSVGTLNIVNARIVKSPYQEVAFGEVKARYVKIKVGPSFYYGDIHLPQMRLFGRLAE
jgi:hypothetical protein